MNDLTSVMEFAKSIPYFPPNSCAWGHAALGFGAGFLDPWAQIVTALGFIAYEVFREKPTNEKVGAVAEFATGYMAQKVVIGGLAK